MKGKLTAKKKNSVVRLIGGQWRGSKLPIADVPGLRPTGDRIRETLFNWLSNALAGSVCLDLFSGSGALGFEALSRGAHKAICIEKHPRAFRQLQANAERLRSAPNSSPGLNRIDLIQADALDWLNQSKLPKFSVNIAFIDPPFAEKLWQSTFERLTNSQLLAANARVYVETPINQKIIIPEKWQIYREKQAGGVCYQLLIADSPPLMKSKKP